ncbi:MAG: hypothetical protein II863_06760, partial [Kiritimatiellae bacterium]|nr:hypothetical protein [Kiritimatiellia bacterium]
VRTARCEEIFAIQSAGLATRLRHTGCRHAVIGISGGLDSALALLVTVEAFRLLGADRSGIHAVIADVHVFLAHVSPFGFSLRAALANRTLKATLILYQKEEAESSPDRPKLTQTC